MGSSLSFFTFMYLSFLLFSFQLTSSRQPVCHDKEHSALLRFKESLSIDHEYFLACSAKTELWNLEGNGNCCSWDGIKCNEDTGYVTKLDLSSSCLCGSINSNSTLFNLVHLQWLSLADNYFNDSKIPSGIMYLSRLSHLNLSDSSFSGQIPQEMLELSNLESLDLSYNWLLQLQQPDLKSLVEKLTNLKVLDLSGVNNISSSQLEVLTNLSTLNFLSLQNCTLEGTIPSSLGNLSNLIHLDLSYNNFWGQIPSEIFELSQLEYLDLSGNEELQQGGLRSLVDKLTNLKWLNLTDVNISSSIPTSLRNLSSLTHLSLRYCKLQGTIPSSLGNLYNLIHLDLSDNNFGGQIPSEMLELSQLEYLDISSNQLQGPIPSPFSKLNNLETLDLSSNNLCGTMELEMFLQLKSLTSLYLSSNRLSLLSNFSVNTSFHKFQSLGLGSCNLMSFPDFLRYQDQLYHLDLSLNNISGQIPGWFLNISENSLQNLNLSHNLLTGFDQRPDVLPWTSQYYLDLRFNRLQGPLPIPPMSTIHYLVSNNKLSGKIPPWMCKLNSLYALDLSNNNMSGKLPKCLGNFSYGLSMLDLQNNKFYGSIPLNFINGTKLRMIDLSNNLLRGKIPRSLVNCTILEYLDLGNNKINDTFPFWMGSLPKLEVLNLKSNKLHGVIEEPKSDFVFPKLRMIDLSHNKFIGKFPSKYFQYWNAMKFDNESGLTYMMKENSTDQMYDYSLTVVNKGIEIEYVKIPNMLTGIWLSSNRFEGEIPDTISILKGLRYLDLSNNNLIGGIPSSLDNLTVLESLVLSNNKLSGEIPQQLVKLTFLEFFNVSCNHLEGPIPQGPQFNTFDNMSYEGNSGLCGQPLSRICGNPMLPQKEDDEGLKSPFAFGWKVVAIGYACGLIVGVFLGYIFCTKKHEWFVKIFGMPLKRRERKRGRPRN